MISAGTWTSNYNCRCSHDYGGIHTAGESDNHLAIEATYTDVKVPRKGVPSIHADASSWTATGAFSMFEDVWTQADPDYPILCNGSFERAGPAPTIATTAATTDQVLHLAVESGKEFKVGNVSGTNCPGLGHWKPFWPFSSASPDQRSPQAYVADMLRVKVAESLHALRSMHVGDVDGATFHRSLEKSCDYLNSSGTCTSALHWTGQIKLERTG